MVNGNKFRGNDWYAKKYNSKEKNLKTVESPLKVDIDPFSITKDEVEKVLDLAVMHGASDIIFMDDDYISCRINGITHHITERKITPADMDIIGVHLRDSERALSEKQGNQDADWKYSQGVRRGQIMFRSNLTPTSAGMSITLRSIPREPPSFDDIGTPEHIRDILKIKKGLVLVAGETGSGKSTLLAAMFKDIIQNTQSNVITYESPIEFDLTAIPNKLSSIAQTEIPTNLASYQLAPRNSLRRAATHVLIGESRDKETFKQLSVMTETGSAVWTTVHTNSVYTTLSRIISEFSEHEQASIMSGLIQSIQTILHQTLVPNPNGGRTPIIEWVSFNDDMRRILSKETPKSLQTVIYDMTKESGILFLQDLEEKYQLGLVTETAYRAYKKVAEAR